MVNRKKKYAKYRKMNMRGIKGYKKCNLDTSSFSSWHIVIINASFLGIQGDQFQPSRSSILNF